MNVFISPKVNILNYIFSDICGILTKWPRGGTSEFNRLLGIASSYLPDSFSPRDRGLSKLGCRSFILEVSPD